MTVVEYSRKISFEKNKLEPFVPADLRGKEVKTTRSIFLEGIKEIVIINENITYNITDNIITLNE